MEVLGHMISKSIENGKWKGVKAARRGPILSHIFFADDLILFGEATNTQAKCTEDVLSKF